MTALRRALEAALDDDPDDDATHAAYADLLAESADAARGEFIGVQMRLEDEALPAAEREALKGRERELLDAYGREWLGALGPLLLHHPQNRGSWWRGWIGEANLVWFDRSDARALAAAPAARFLRRLHIEYCSYSAEDELNQPGRPEEDRYPDFEVLSPAAFLRHMRTFQLGEMVSFDDENYDSHHTGMDGLADLVGLMPRVEELYLLARGYEMGKLFSLPNLTRLRTLQVYHDHEIYPLDILAANSALRALETLRLHPAHADHNSYLPRSQVRALLNSPHLAALKNLHLHASDLGDAGCRDLVESGILDRLEVLDLRHGCVTDAGARTLAECPAVRRLRLLSLEDNQLTEVGRELLGGLGIEVRCQSQAGVGSDDYLFSGDME